MTIETINQSAGEWMLALKAAKVGFEKLDIDLTPEALNAGAATILIHATKIHPSSMTANGNGSAGHAAPARTAPDEFEDVTCDKCGGEVWDNRTNKRNPKGPDYKCKDTACNRAAWVNKDGSLSWKS